MIRNRRTILEKLGNGFELQILNLEKNNIQVGQQNKDILRKFY